LQGSLRLRILSSPHTREPSEAALGIAHEMSFADKALMLAGVGLPPIGLIVAIVLLWGHGVGWLQLGLLFGMYGVTVIGITVGYHRLLTHRAFETTAPIRFLLAAAGSMANQGQVIQWCAVHRRHHQASDREGDPHSPHLFGSGIVGLLRGMWHSHMGWLFEADPVGIERSVRDLVEDRAICFIDRTFMGWVVLGLIIPGAIGFAVLHTWSGAFSCLLWGGLVRMFLMHHATFSINSVCHIWGTRPFQSTDESRNNPIFGIVSFGEGWHNNHHAFPTSARHGLRWWQLDISWLFIRTLEITGLAWHVRVPSESAQAAKVRGATNAAPPNVAPATAAAS
jgi:stearoyl-CoA desaturase (Delta-9 desaturase)